MSTKQARNVLLFVLASSVLILLLSALGVFGGRDAIPALAHPEKLESAVKEAAQRAEASVKESKELQINQGDIAQKQIGQTVLQVWSATSSVSPLYAPDVAALQGRDAGSDALSGIIVIVDPGHGGDDTGAVYDQSSSDPSSYGKNITLNIANALKTELESFGATVLLTRPSDHKLSLQARTAQLGDSVLRRLNVVLEEQAITASVVERLLNLMGDIVKINSDAQDTGGRGIFDGIGTPADVRVLYDLERQFSDTLFISLQCDDISSDESQRGTRVSWLGNEQALRFDAERFAASQKSVINPTYQFYDDANRKRLAELISEQILARYPEMTGSGEAVQQEDHVLLRNINTTSVLVRLGYLNHEDDFHLLSDSTTQTEYGRVIAQAVYQYYCR